MSKTILITGANGTLAKKLIEKFNKDDNYRIIGSLRNLQDVPSCNGVQYIKNEDLITTNILKDIDLVINTAFPRNENTEELYSAMQFFECLIIKSIELNVDGIINISSQSVYGSYRETPSFEINNLHPENNYAITKIACESIGWALTKDSSTKLTSIRLASLVGVEYPERVINKIIKNAIETKSISIANDKNVLGYMDIEDAVNGLYQFVINSTPENWKAIYNFGQKYENVISLKVIAQTIKSLFEKINWNIELNINEMKKADKSCLMDSRWFFKDSNWQPEISLRQSIENIFTEIVQNQK